MNIGIFTDSYLPQISGVATSIKTLTDELTKAGHTVYIFTTTDPLVSDELALAEMGHVIRLRSVPFIAMRERRMVMAGLGTALQIARHYALDIIHTQTEFGVGILGKMVANQMQIPVIHTMHTKYEDYLHYIANGRLIRPAAVKYVVRTFLLGTEGVICPSEMTRETVEGYGVKCPIRVIPTGIETARFVRPDITSVATQTLRHKLGIAPDEIMLLTVSRLSYEKNIQALLRAMPEMLRHCKVKLVIVGYGPYHDDLENLVADLDLYEAVTFTGRVSNDRVVYYYKAADFLISASTSETQGLTFSEALAAGTPVLAAENAYLTRLIDATAFGRLFASDADIATVSLAAIRGRQPMEAAAYAKKCDEISSTTFAARVLDFYEYMIDSYQPLRARVSGNLRQSSDRLVTRVQKTPTAIANFIKKYGKIGGTEKKKDE